MSGFKSISRFTIPKQKSSSVSSSSFQLIICQGSIVDFRPHKPTNKNIEKSSPASASAAIVNAANESCLGGGGVDGAISSAGGINLHNDRLALPIVSVREYEDKVNADDDNDDDDDDDDIIIVRSERIRCPTGHAKITGPSKYSALHVPYVIHAVGPAYFTFPRSHYHQADALLQSAYSESLQRAREKQLKEVAFSLLSAGVFRGGRTRKEVLGLAVSSIVNFDFGSGSGSRNNDPDAAADPDPDAASSADDAKKKEISKCSYEELENVYMFAYSALELNVLLRVCQEMGLEEETVTNDNNNC